MPLSYDELLKKAENFAAAGESDFAFYAFCALRKIHSTPAVSAVFVGHDLEHARFQELTERLMARGKVPPPTATT